MFRLRLPSTPSFLIALTFTNVFIFSLFMFNDQTRKAVLSSAQGAIYQSNKEVIPTVPKGSVPKHDELPWEDPEAQFEKPCPTPVLPVPVVLPTQPAECNYCTATDAICEKYGDFNLARSRAYEGPSARLRRVLAKARSGQPTKVAILGGSVSAGHGVDHFENWAVMFFEWWKKKFPHPDNAFINGAVPAVTSEYYSACAREHIDEDVDLIVIELAIQDPRHEYFAHSYEWLLRDLLSMPKQPAIVYVHVIALSFDWISLGGDLHLGMAQYYDIPTINIRNILAAHIMNDPSMEDHYFTHLGDGKVDLRHINLNGHQMLFDTLISYFERQICAEAKHPRLYWQGDGHGEEHVFNPDTEDSLILPHRSSLFEIPRQRMLEAYAHNKVTPKTHPSCFTMGSKKNPPQFLVNEGWAPWSWKDKHYLVAKQPGSKISFEVDLVAMGVVLIYYQRSRTFGLGDLKCWIDDNVDKAEIFSGYWEEDTNLLRQGTIINGVAPGKHIVHCELMESTLDPGGGTEFRLVSFASV